MNYLLQLVEFRKRKLCKQLTSNAILLYHTLLEFSNEIGFPESFTAANTSLQSKSSLSKNKLLQARDQLAEEGFITYIPGTRNQCGTYVLTDLTVRHEPKAEPQTGTQNESQIGSQNGSQIGSQIGSQNGSQIGSQNGSQIGSQIGSQNGSQTVPKTGPLTKQDLNEKKPNQTHTHQEKLSASGFDSFWNAYPKKQAKTEAIKAFLKLTPDKELLDKMLEAIELFSRSDSWKYDNGRYIPLPSTWLNGKRWEDETITVKKKGMSDGTGGCPY